MGGGQRYFDPKLRIDHKDLCATFRSKNYNIVTKKDQLKSNNNNEPLLGLFSEEALPYEIDRQSNKELFKNIPTLKEMTEAALENLKGSANGFVLQVEAGKVDWAAHANEAATLLYDQIAFDDAIEAAIKFAKEDGETLVIIASDHGNANPKMMHGKNVNENFDRLQTFKYTNEWVLNNITKDDSTSKVRDIIQKANNYNISYEQAISILDYYQNLGKPETGLYNYKNLPFKLLSVLQQVYHFVG